MGCQAPEFPIMALHRMSGDVHHRRHGICIHTGIGGMSPIDRHHVMCLHTGRGVCNSLTDVMTCTYRASNISVTEYGEL